MVRGSELVGKGMENVDGESLGTIQDLVIRPTGEIAFVVVSSRDVAGAGEQLTAVPWQSVQMSDEGKPQADIAKERFADAPKFSQDQWPDLSEQGTFATRTESWFEAPLGERMAEETTERQDEEPTAFSALDQDGDGRISREEALGSETLEQNFTQADQNGDGAIDGAEFSAFEESATGSTETPDVEIQDPGAGVGESLRE
jgi:hypothetical protein